MKIRHLVTALFLTFINLVAPATAIAEDSRVILDKLLTGDVPQLNADDIKIPDDLKPGFHELQVEVLDDSGVISSKTALFCKDLTGELNFDNICPDLLVTNEQKTFRSALKPYDPVSDPVGSATFALVGFAVASTLLASSRSSNAISNLREEDDDESMGDFGNVSAAKLAKQEKDLAWGDRRRYINTLVFNSFDPVSKSLAQAVSSISHLLARAIIDARYLRAILGNFAWLTIPSALVVAYLGVQQIDNQALPLLLTPLILLIVIGILDAFAGFVGAFLYLNFVFANGNINSKDSLFTCLGVALIFFAPALIASKFRPWTRDIKDFSSIWERATDYVLTTLLTGWSVYKLVQALPGLSKLQLPIVEDAALIGILAAAAIALRFTLEEIAWYLYPKRLQQLSIELKPAGSIQELRAVFFRTGVFYLLAEPFIGTNIFLAIGCAIFIIPQLINLVSNELPKSKYIAQINPRGAFKIVTLSIISIYLLEFLKTLKLSNADFILTSFAIMPIPALIFMLIDAFSGKRPIDITLNEKFRYVYRITGVVTLLLLILVIAGKNPIESIYSFFVNFNEYLNTFLKDLENLWLLISTLAVEIWGWIYQNTSQLLSEGGLKIEELFKSIFEDIEYGWSNFSTNMGNFWTWFTSSCVDLYDHVVSRLEKL